VHIFEHMRTEYWWFGIICFWAIAVPFTIYYFWYVTNKKITPDHMAHDDD